MLYKSELKKIPLCKPPKFSREELKDKSFISTSAVIETSKCGKILVVDYYSIQEAEIQARFFTDGNNHITYMVKNDIWSKNSIIGLLLKRNSRSVHKESDLDVAKKFLGISYFYTYSKRYDRCLTGLDAVCEKITQRAYFEQYRNKKDNEVARMRYHFSLFPALKPKGINKFCDEIVFDTTYIFFGSKRKGKYQAICGHCGKSFDAADAKHGQKTMCPKCKKSAIYCAERYNSADKLISKNTIIIPYKHKNQLLLEWLEVKRAYLDGQPQFSYAPIARRLYLVEGATPKIYSYEYKNVMCYGYSWVGGNRYNINIKGYVYQPVLKSVFGEKYYNVDLYTLIKNYPRKINFVKLLDNLKNIPACEYLCKQGLVTLACEINESQVNKEAKSFGELFGVSNQYLSLYRDMQVNLEESNIIVAAKEYVKKDLFLKLRQLNNSVEYWRRSCIPELLERMSATKLCNYCDKQAAKYENVAVSQILIWMIDYIGMCDEMDIQLDKRTMFPASIKEAHDILAKRVAEVRAKEQEESSKAALKVVNQFFKGYSDAGFTVRVPKKRADFIKEGQELSHCVGSERYYNNHVAGTRMIFFIRRADDPNKAFYTAEIDMANFDVVQLYGYGDCLPPKDVRVFTKKFAQYLMQQCASVRKSA
ncbi:MAG: PcfJ domain-containing protein [Clostridia bacterium]|nr:PcfJ domain-containing protein [Clostridia bacterium]